MRYIILILGFSIYSCNHKKQNEKVKVFESENIKILIQDKSGIDTLDICQCWKTKDSIVVDFMYSPRHLFFGGKSGFLKIINNIPETQLFYFSDYTEFNGNFDLFLENVKDEIDLRYIKTQKGISLKGFIDTETNDSIVNNRIYKIKAKGYFECFIANE